MAFVPPMCEIALLRPAPAGPHEYWFTATFLGSYASKVFGVVLAAGVDRLEALCGAGLTVWRREAVFGVQRRCVVCM